MLIEVACECLECERVQVFAHDLQKDRLYSPVTSR